MPPLPQDAPLLLEPPLLDFFSNTFFLGWTAATC
jgi:hypothetical protein